MHADRGFTLLEVLVAFVITALALAGLYQGGISGLTAAAVAARYGEALSLAESHLARAGAASEFAPQDGQGDEGDGYHWHLRIEPAAFGAAAGPAKPVPALYAITVAISWMEGRQTRTLTLQTQRAGTAPSPPP